MIIISCKRVNGKSSKNYVNTCTVEPRYFEVPREMKTFLASGARAVLAALWAVEDEATMWFMNCFYQHLVRGESASESLHQAMKWMRENGFSDVGQWAPFMLIGDDVSFDFQN